MSGVSFVPSRWKLSCVSISEDESVENEGDEDEEEERCSLSPIESPFSQYLNTFIIPSLIPIIFIFIEWKKFTWKLKNLSLEEWNKKILTLRLKCIQCKPILFIFYFILFIIETINSIQWSYSTSIQFNSTIIPYSLSFNKITSNNYFKIMNTFSTFYLGRNSMGQLGLLIDDSDCIVSINFNNIQWILNPIFKNKWMNKWLWKGTICFLFLMTFWIIEKQTEFHHNSNWLRWINYRFINLTQSQFKIVRKSINFVCLCLYLYAFIDIDIDIHYSYLLL